jgi:hypothetical protein
MIRNQFIHEPAAERIYMFHQYNLHVNCHSKMDDLVVKEFTCNHRGNLYYVRIENQFTGLLNQFKFAVLGLIQTSKQRIELHLNREKIFYTKSGMFRVSVSSCYQFEPEFVKLASAAYPSGGQIKSNFYIIDHPVVIVGQWSPSSSEDG